MSSSSDYNILENIVNFPTPAINWDEVAWRGTCEKCKTDYDVLAEGHISLCGICAILFADDIPHCEPPPPDPATSAPIFASEMPQQPSGTSVQHHQTPPRTSALPKQALAPTNASSFAPQMTSQYGGISGQHHQTPPQASPLPKPASAPTNVPSFMHQMGNQFGATTGQPRQAFSSPSQLPTPTPNPQIATSFVHQLVATSSSPRQTLTTPSSLQPPMPKPQTSTTFAHQLARHLVATSSPPRPTPSPPTQPTIPATTAAAAAAVQPPKQTTPKKAKTPMPEKNCGRCSRKFRQNRNNNGVDCTQCCNQWATRGYSLFAKEGMNPSARAAKAIDDYYKKQQSESAGAGAGATPATPSPEVTAAPVVHASGSTSSNTASPVTPVMNAPLQPGSGSRKRLGTELDGEDQAGENDQALKRSRLDAVAFLDVPDSEAFQV